MMNKLEMLYSQDKNLFWKKLKSMKGGSQDENLPQLDRLITHFEKLYHKNEHDDELTN